MSYSLGGELKGADELLRNLKSSPQVVQKAVGDAIMKTAVRVQNVAVPAAPVRTAALRGSITIAPIVYSGNNISTTVGTDLPYAQHQEYGTGIYGKRKDFIYPKRSKFLVFKVGNKKVFARRVKGTEGKFYMKKGRQAGSEVLQGYLDQAGREITSHLAR